MLKVAHFQLENALHFASMHINIYIANCFHFLFDFFTLLFCFKLFPQFTPQPQRLIELVRVLTWVGGKKRKTWNMANNKESRVRLLAMFLFLKGIALSCQDADTWIRRCQDARIDRQGTRFSGPGPLVSFTLWNTHTELSWLENHFDSLPSHTQNIFALIWELNCWANRCQIVPRNINWPLSLLSQGESESFSNS